MKNSSKEISISLRNFREVNFISLYFLSSYCDLFATRNKSGRYVLSSEIGKGHKFTDPEIDRRLLINDDVSLIIGDKSVVSAFAITADCVNNARSACHYLHRTLKDIYYIPSYSVVAYHDGDGGYIVAVLWGKSFESKELSVFNELVKTRVEPHMAEKYHAQISLVSEKGAYLPLPFFSNKQTGVTRNLVIWKNLMPITDLYTYSCNYKYMDTDTASRIYDLACRLALPEKTSYVKSTLINIDSEPSEIMPPSHRQVTVSDAELCYIASQDTPSRRKLLFALLLCFKCYGQYEYGPVRISPRSLSKLCNLNQDTVTEGLNHLIESYEIFKCPKESVVPFVNIALDDYKLRGTIPNGYMLSDFSKEKINSYIKKDAKVHDFTIDYVSNVLSTLNSKELKTMYQKVIQSVFTDCSDIRNQKHFSNKEAFAIKARVCKQRCDAQDREMREEHNHAPPTNKDNNHLLNT